MKRLLLSALLFGSGTAFASAADFHPPVRLKVGDALPPTLLVPLGRVSRFVLRADTGPVG